MTRLLVFDKRLIPLRERDAHPPSSVYDQMLECDHDTPIGKIINWVSHNARASTGRDELYIMCHGAVAGAADDLHVPMSSAYTGGLILGREGLHHFNVNLTRPWQGRLRRIVLLACSLAAAHPNPRFDNRRFCGMLAQHTVAQVYGADMTQVFNCATVYQIGPVPLALYHVVSYASGKDNSTDFRPETP